MNVSDSPSHSGRLKITLWRGAFQSLTNAISWSDPAQIEYMGYIQWHRHLSGGTSECMSCVAAPEERT